MKKLLRIAALVILVISVFSTKSFSQVTDTISSEKALKYIHKYTKKYKNGVLKKNPNSYLVKFSRQDLIDLINSVENTDSIFLAFGTVPKDYKVDSLRKKPTIIFQFRENAEQDGEQNDTPGGSFPKSVYKMATDICPPPRNGCRLGPMPPPHH